MELGVQEFLIISTTLCVFLYYYTSGYNYWKKLGVYGPKPIFFFGSYQQVFLKKSTAAEMLSKIYSDWKNKASFVGIYKCHKPQLLITNLDLIKHILITDFSYFTGRGMTTNKEVDPLSENLFNIDGPRWRILRQKLTPTFTSGKLKNMIQLMIECADVFEASLKKKISEKEETIIDCRKLAENFTVDVIGSCVFGINMNAQSQEENSQFRKFARDAGASNFLTILKRTIRDVWPVLFKLMKFRIIPRDGSKFFIKSIKETIAARREKNIFRNDMVQLLMEIQDNNCDDDFEFTDGLMAAQAFIFFFAGETFFYQFIQPIVEIFLWQNLQI